MRMHKAHLLSLLKSLLDTLTVRYLENPVMLTELETWNPTRLGKREALCEDPPGFHQDL